MSEPLAKRPFLLRPREAATLLSVSMRTLWRWTHTGRIPAVRVGRVIRYPYHALKAWVEEQAQRTDHRAQDTKA